MKKNVVIGFLGSQLDAGRGSGRWSKWRPSVSILQHEDKLVSRFELLHTAPHKELAEAVKADMATVSPETEVRLIALDVADPWDFGEMYGALFDWVRAYAFDARSEEYLVHITTGTHVAQICMFVLVESRFIPGVLLQTAPSKKHSENSPGTFTLIDLDLSRYDVLAKRFEKERNDAVSFLKSGIATRNLQFNSLIDEIERVAVRSKAPILLTGPTGAGKSHLARRTFELKKSRHQVSGQFVELNCATVHGDGAASTLFGHKKGAFTGAAGDRAGLLRTAHEGVLFLDEIGELGIDEQAMLLKAVEEKRFFPVGSDKEVTSDFQLIAGTNRDLRADVASGRFRDDLYARINLWSYTLPGLAQRAEDIEPNVDELLLQSSLESKQSVRFNVEAKRKYLRFAESTEAVWSGNFRDLAASVTRLSTLAEGGRITVDLVDSEIRRLRWSWERSSAGNNAEGNAVTGADIDSFVSEEILSELDLFDRLQLQAVIVVCKESRSLSEAGRKLFDCSRARLSIVNDADRLRKYLRKFKLVWSDFDH